MAVKNALISNESYVNFNYRNAISNTEPHQEITLIGIGNLGRCVINECIRSNLERVQYYFIESIDRPLNYKSNFYKNSELENPVELINYREIPDARVHQEPLCKTAEFIASRSSFKNIILVVVDLVNALNIDMLNLVLEILHNEISPICILTSRPLPGTKIEDTKLETMLKLSDSIVELFTSDIHSLDSDDDTDFLLIHEFHYFITILTQTIKPSTIFNLDLDDLSYQIRNNRYIRFYSHYAIDKRAYLIDYKTDKLFYFCDLDFDEIKTFSPIIYHIDLDTTKYTLDDISRVIHRPGFLCNENTAIFSITHNEKPRNQIFVLEGSNDVDIIGLLKRDRTELLMRAIAIGY